MSLLPSGSATAVPRLTLTLPARREFNWQRAARKRPCPVCGYTDWCEISDDGLTVHCMRRPGDRAVDWRGGGWLHFFGGGSDLRVATATAADLRAIPAPVAVNPAGKAALAPAETRAAAINWLLARLDLNEEHAAHLAGEDLLEPAFELGYRTLPGDPTRRRALLDGLAATFGSKTAGLGFVYERAAKGGGRYLEFAGVPRGADALLLPIRDLQGNPIALKARYAAPDGERRYRAMSAGNADLGASVGVPVHVSRPPFFIPGLESWVIVTEGEKKADFAARCLGLTCLGVQGISNWRAGGLLPLLAELRARVVVEAFDADRESKPQVERQARQLAEQCAGAGLTVYSARWPLAAGKGLDDFLRGQSEEIKWPDLRRFRPEKGGQEAAAATGDDEFKRRYGLPLERAGRVARQYVGLDAATLEARAKLLASPDNSAPAVSLAEAREALSALFRQAFDHHMITGGKEPGRYLLRTTTGTGKTHAAIHKVIEHLALGRPGRILYLTDTKQAYAHLLEPDGPLWHERQAGRVAVREGRADAPGPYHCERYEDCRVLGDSRQPASADACGQCPFGSAANWKKYAAQFGFHATLERPFECEREGYLASVRRCKEAQVVIGPKSAVLNASEELSEFDYIIVDEDCLSFLLERQDLSAGQLAQWEEARRRLEREAILRAQRGEEPEPAGYFEADGEPGRAKDFASLRAEHEPFDRLFALVEAARRDFEAASNQPGRARFLPVLLARADAEGENFAALLNRCQAIHPGLKFKRYAWEKPYRASNAPGAPLVVPLRFAHDLLSLLEGELEVEDGGDTRLWLERRQTLDGGTEALLAVYLPRQNLLKILNGERQSFPNHFGQAPTVFFLDATAGPEFRLALPQVKEVEIKVPQPLYLVQTTNSLYTKESLLRGRTLENISRAITTLAERFGAERPVIFSRKAFNPDYQEGDGPALRVEIPGARYGHFERHNRGLNDYDDADLLAIVGHYSHPIEEVEARVQALRGRKQGLAPQERQGRYRLRAYRWQDRDGQGLARWCRCHPDPDVQAAIEHSTWATLMQTIGRGRAALRSPERPLVVALFSALPVEQLPVQELTDLNELLEQERISSAQRAALDVGREAANARRHAEAQARIEAAKQAFAAAGESFVPPARFARAAGVSRSLLWRMGYGQRGRWVRVVAIRERFSQEMFISLKYYPAGQSLESFSPKSSPGVAELPAAPPPERRE